MNKEKMEKELDELISKYSGVMPTIEIIVILENKELELTAPLVDAVILEQQKLQRKIRDSIGERR